MAIENPKYGKGIALAASFDPGIKAPLDSRLTVATIEERDAHVEGNRAYDGMVVYVEGDKAYQYTIKDGVGSWKPFGFNDEDFIARVANDLVTDDEAKALSAAQGVALKGLIDAEAERAGEAEAGLQTAIDELAETVGQLPEGTSATSVVDYVNIKTAGIATDAALEELNNQVSGLQTAVQEIQKDYLVEEDKTELANAIAAEAELARAAEKANADAIKVISDDYLKKSDKEELQGNINEVSEALELLTNGVDAETVDGVNDLIKYVNDHGTEVTGIKSDIQENADAIASEKERAEAKEAEIDAELAKKALKTELEAETQAREGAIDGLDERLQAVEGKLGDGEGNVDAQIESAIATEVENRNAAIQTAKEEAAEDAQGKADKALEDAKAHADAEFVKDRERLVALEAVDHEHANKAELDLIESGDKSKWDEAAEKAHIHANAEELAKIVEGDVNKWNSIADDMTEYVDGEINKVEAIIGDIESGKTVIQLLAEMREACEAGETQAVADAQAYTDGKVATVNAKIGEVPEGQTVLSQIEAARAAAVESANGYADEKIEAVVGKVETGKTVLELIEAARAAAIATAEEKDAVVLENANKYTDEKVGAIDLSGIATNADAIASLQGDVEALQAVKHQEIGEDEIAALFPEA